MLELESVVKHYREADEEIRAVDGVSLTVSPGEIVALHGPSGRQTRELAERLCADPRVLGFEIEPRNP